MTQRITTIAHIAARPDVVWAFISDVQRYPEWVVGTTQVLASSTAQAQLGTEYRELTQLGPRTSPSTWRITAFRAPREQTHESRSAMFHASLTMTVEAAGDHTRFTHHVDISFLPRVRPLGRLLEVLMRRQIVTDMRQSLQQARRIIEQDAAVQREPARQRRRAHAHATA